MSSFDREINHRIMNKANKKLGIIGGMGPLAAAFFYRAVVEHTEAACDQDHIITYMISDPTVPKRVEYILGQGGESPEPSLQRIAKELQDMGAEIVAMPCVTAHYFYEGISSSVSVPVINLLDETVRVLKDFEVKRAGILATEATCKSGIVQKALEKAGIEALLPDDEGNSVISKVIFEEIKTGKKADTGSLFNIMDSLRERGAEKCLVACTDLSACLYGIRDERFEDLMDILAAAAVRECLNSAL